MQIQRWQPYRHVQLTYFTAILSHSSLLFPQALDLAHFFFILMVMMRWVKLVRYFGVTSFPHILLTPKRLSKTIWTGITGIDRSEPHACSKSATLFESVVEKLPWFWLFIHTYTAISETGLVYGIALFCINSMYKFHIIYCYLSSYLRGISVFGCYSSYLEGVIFVTSFFIKVLGVHLLVLLKSC